MIYLRFENKETHRYYRLLLSKDMFNDWVITKIWGGINQSSGRVTHLPCENLSTAITAIEQITKTRIRRGYLIVDKKIEDSNIINETAAHLQATLFYRLCEERSEYFSE